MVSIPVHVYDVSSQGCQKSKPAIGRLLCLAFFCKWNFLNKISPDWLHTLTTQLSTLKLSDNPGSSFFFFCARPLTSTDDYS